MKELKRINQMTVNQKKLFLSTGMIAVLFYMLHVLLGGFLWKEYDHLQQPISDLTATGSPNRNLMLLLTSIYGVLAIIFALSFTMLECKKHFKLVFYGGVMLSVMYVISITYGLFPEDLPNQGMTFLGSMHIVITALIVPFTILAPIFIGLGFMKEKTWKSFGIYSFISGCLILIFGSLCAVFFIYKMPGFGLIERINIGVLQAWLFLLSLKSITK